MTASRRACASRGAVQYIKIDQWGKESARAERRCAGQEETAMAEIFAQGDLLLERVDDVTPSGTIEENMEGMPVVLAEGEATGHRHAIWERVTMFRDALLARDIPAGLYIGHLQVAGGHARLLHDEHAPITLPRGTYRVRRQRELGPRDARVLPD
jgi:hypothetical protein